MSAYFRYVEPWWENRKWRSYAIKETGLSSSQLDKYHAKGIEFWDLEDFGRVNPQALDALLTDQEVLEEAQREAVTDNELNSKISDLVAEIAKHRAPFLNDYYFVARSKKGSGAYTTLAAHSYGVGLEDLLKIPEPNKVDFLVLIKHRIPVEYSVPRLQEGQNYNLIIYTYSTEKCGVSPDIRRRYLAVKWDNNKRLSDDQITILDRAEMKPEYFEEMVKSKERIFDFKIFSLMGKRKLNGEVYSRWRQAGIPPDQIIFSLEHDYDLSLAKRILALGKTAQQYHEDLHWYQLLSNGQTEKSPVK